MGLSDIGWSQLYFTKWRWQHHDITSSYDEDKACLMVNVGLHLTWACMYMFMFFFMPFQHRKPGYLSPVTALYFPFSPNLWVATISAIFLSLCFSSIYAIAHPEPELSAYNLVTMTLASIYKKENLRPLKSVTVR